MGVNIDEYWAWPLNQKLRSIAPSNFIRSTAIKPTLPRKELVSCSCLFRYRHCAYFCFLPVSRCPFTECQGHVAVSVAARSRLCCRWVPKMYSLCAFNNLGMPTQLCNASSVWKEPKLQWCWRKTNKQTITNCFSELGCGSFTLVCCSYVTTRARRRQRLFLQ